jgi:O-antigen ligase
MKQLLARIESLVFYLLILLLPTQLGKHFWPDFSYVLGLRIDYLSPTLYFTDLLIGLLLACWFYRVLKEKLSRKSKIKNQKSKFQFKIQKLKKSPAWILVASYLLLVGFFSGEILKSLYYLLKIFEMAFVAYYTAKFIGVKNVFHKSVSVYCVAVVLQSLLAIAQFVKQGSVGGALYFLGERAFSPSTPGIANASLNGELVLRPYGTLPHPNVLAGYLLIGMILTLFSLNFQSPEKVLSIKYKVLSKRLAVNGYWLLAIGSLIIGSIALFLSMSRIVILFWIIVIGFFFIKKINLKMFLTVAAATLILFLLSPFGARYSQVAITDEAVVQRVVLISASLEMVKSSPILGVGLGNYIPTLAQMQSPLTVGTYLQPVHNIYLLVASEAGLLGLGLFLWFLWKTFGIIMNYELQLKKPLLFALLAILITGFFDHYWLTLQQGQLLFAFVIGLCWSGKTLHKL